MGPLSSVSVSAPNVSTPQVKDQTSAKFRDDNLAGKTAQAASFIDDVVGKTDDDKSFKRQQQFAETKLPQAPQQTGQRRGNLLDLVI